MKIAVVGLGGVGGYLAGMMAASLPDVTVVARKQRGVSIREKGLILHSDFHGEKVSHPAVVESSSDLLHQDIIFVCVKNYSLETACAELKNVVDENTIVIPVMNGVDPGERIRTYLPACTVVDSLIYVVAYANADYSIQQEGKFAHIYIGLADPNEKEKQAVAVVAQALREADIDVTVPDDIQVAIWKKYILNCAYNVETAAYDYTIGELREDPLKAEEYARLTEEACAVARAKGIKIPENLAENYVKKFYEMAPDSTSSLQRDYRDGKKETELETFCGYLVREAARLNIAVPVMNKMYKLLREK